MKNSILKFALKNAVTHDGKAQLNAIIPKMIGENINLKDKVKELVSNINEILKQVNKMSLEEQKKMLMEQFPEILIEKKEERKGFPELPGVKEKLVMRFAPFPSGPLHIGNARTLIINDEYAKKYNGKLLLVIDDTIGSEQKPIIKDAYKLIPEALKWLKVKYEPKIIYKSDRMEPFYKYGTELIKRGAAYACECPNALVRDYRAKGIACNHRSNTVSENLEMWNNMLKGEYGEGGAVVRLKTDMKDKDPAFRDRILFRISKREHERVGNKYHVWPLLEMSWAVDDHLLGITHIIRGKDLQIEDRMERFIWKVLDWNNPIILHNGLVKLQGVKISKSKSSLEVKKGEYLGWDDPRTWSIQSLKRRGFAPEAIREFVKGFGMSLNDITIPIKTLYSINRKLIDHTANRYFFVKEPVKLIINGCKEGWAKVSLHPDKKGIKKYKIKKGKNVVWIAKKDFKKGKFRLKDYANVIIRNDSTADYSKDQKTVYDIKKIHYVIDKKFSPCKVLQVDGSYHEGYCEEYCKNIKKGEVIQFERYGFCRLEKKNKNGLEFIYSHA